VPSDDKYQKEEILQLISKGKRQGFLSWEEIDQTLGDEFGAEDDFDDFLNDLADQSEPTPPPVSAETLAGELDVDMIPEDSVSVELSASEGLPEIEPAEAEVRFDDVAAFSKDMAEPPVPQASKPDLSTELLMRIAEELSSSPEACSAMPSSSMEKDGRSEKSGTVSSGVSIAMSGMSGMSGAGASS